MELNLEGKVVIVTGASSGIGEETAIRFFKCGSKLALTGRNEENLNRVSAACGGAITIKGDYAKDQDLAKKIVEETIKAYGKIDVLVNNAGCLEVGGIESTSLEQYDRIFDVNVRAVYRLTMLVVPHLVKTKGTIVNVSSVAGLRSFPGVLSYCMSKSAIDQFTKCTALDLASKGVRVNSVNPGFVQTQLHREMGISEEQYREYINKSKTNHPLGRVGEVGEIADAIIFLASDKATFITGVNLSVDGGRQAMCPR